MIGYTILFVGYGIMAAALIITGVVLQIDLHKGDKQLRELMKSEHDRICKLLRGENNAQGRLEQERGKGGEG